MNRGMHLIQTLQHSIPPVFIPIFIIITILGSLGFILPGILLLYWRWDADRALFVGSAVLGGIGITLTLKNLFALPRPPISYHLVYVTGYGFPSQHAIDSTVTYGALASVVRRGTRWQRGFVAGLVIGLVALSRVILGVHYVTDVIAGILVGLEYLVIVVVVLDRNIRRCLFLAIIPAIAAVIVTDGSWKSVILLSSVAISILWWYHTRAQ
ncbi:phosphatase PAP2 family protein [Haladaptatus sp. W1]|uniref:phosphatase PAP2 family protein n=1 Tax=Haladaptatus sp. W1 TaxID=1897478 RepID=UPI0009F456E1